MATKTKAKKTAKKTATSRAKGAKAKTRRAATAKRGALRLESASPSLTANDLEKSLAFYRDVLGFELKERWDEGGKLLGVILGAGDAAFYMSQDDWKKGRDRQKGVGFRITCATKQDVDKLASAMKGRGASLDQEPTSEEWGRFFSLTDPDGFKVTIVNERKRRR